ncbi:MAG: hypothetical protein NZ749_14740, partial [bacterium]|nr:hypothetical protein [bacterium]
FAVGAEAPGMTDSGEEGVGFWTRERKGLSLLLFLSLVTYAYTRLAEVSLPGIVVISVCLVLLNVGILVWFAYHWRRRLS